MPTRKLKVPLPDGVKIDDFVRFYANGWYFGWLKEVKGSTAGIQVGNHPRLKWVGIDDIRKME